MLMLFSFRMLEENDRLNSKPSNEEIHDTTSKKVDKSFELFNASKVSLFTPKIKGIQPKFFHKIKTRSLFIDHSILS